ncbi:group II intron reverse transcriptase/maturase [Escherichia coli]|nr:group II intron reverse transcriptase/maturase [Escherichia coli]
MNVERRGSVGQSAPRPNCTQEEAGGEQTKPFQVSKLQVVEAYRRIKANAGSAGVDNQTLKDFDRDLKGNLYKIWNRLSSGSWMPPPVRAVEIPKKDGSNRLLGIPTVSDRIAQMTVLITFEPLVERDFLNDSYGYRPGKSALDAIAVTRKRCWQYDWCLEFDIRGLFDNIPHDLLLRAVDKHCADKWVRLFIRRWLTAPVQMPDGTQRERNKGTPQGGVISPVLANLFLHYVFDKWLTLRYPGVPWCRYADDGLVHCVNKQQAEELRDKLAVRFQECGLELHPEKTKIVYLNLTLISWARKKYKTLRYRKTKACQLMERLSKEKPELFAHWKAGPESAFA